MKCNFHSAILFQNECSFVSLRDVERAMTVITWFFVNSELISSIVPPPGNYEDDEYSTDGSDEDADLEESEEEIEQVNI